MLAMYFSLMAEQTARIGEAADVVAFGLFADVRSFVLVHMFPITSFSVLDHLARIDRTGRLTSTRTSSKMQAAAVVHVRRGCNTASLPHFEVVLETCDCFDENGYPLPHLGMASKIC